MFPKKGNVFPATGGPQGPEAPYPAVVAAALQQSLGPVSYTHLTLPTNREV